MRKPVQSSHGNQAAGHILIAPWDGDVCVIPLGRHDLANQKARIKTNRVSDLSQRIWGKESTSPPFQLSLR